MQNSTIHPETEKTTAHARRSRSTRWRSHAANAVAILALLRTGTYALVSICGEFTWTTPCGTWGISSIDRAFWQSLLLLIAALILTPHGKGKPHGAPDSEGVLSSRNATIGLVILWGATLWLRGVYFSYFKVLLGMISAPVFPLWHVHATSAASLVAALFFWRHFRSTLHAIPILLGCMMLVSCPLWTGIGVGTGSALLLVAILWGIEDICRARGKGISSRIAWVIVVPTALAVAVLFARQRDVLPSLGDMVRHIIPGFGHVIAVVGLLITLCRKRPEYILTAMLLTLLYAIGCTAQISWTFHLAALAVPLAVVCLTHGAQEVWAFCDARGNAALVNASLLLIFGVTLDAITHGFAAFPFSVIWSSP